METITRHNENLSLLNAELNAYELRLQSAKNFAPHKVGYYEECVKQVKNKIKEL